MHFSAEWCGVGRALRTSSSLTSSARSAANETMPTSSQPLFLLRT